MSPYRIPVARGSGARLPGLDFQLSQRLWAHGQSLNFCVPQFPHHSGDSSGLLPRAAAVCEVPACREARRWLLSDSLGVAASPSSDFLALSCIVEVTGAQLTPSSACLRLIAVQEAASVNTTEQTRRQAGVGSNPAFAVDSLEGLGHTAPPCMKATPAAVTGASARHGLVQEGSFLAAPGQV